MSDEVLRVDCFGHASHESLDVDRRGRRVRFDFAEAQPRVAGEVGLYVDYFASATRAWLTYPRARRVALLSEPLASRPFLDRPELERRFRVVLTHDAHLLERGAPYREFPFGTTWVEGALAAEADLRKDRLVSMIGARHLVRPSPGHRFRNEVLDALDGRDDVDVFGRDSRPLENKLDGLARYSFSIAMENGVQDFYFTEKLIDCLLTDTVPIYYGCPGIGRYFDPAGFLCFSTLKELERHLRALSDDLYDEMLPAVRANRERAFAAGWVTRRQQFERCADVLLDTFEGERGRPLRPRLLRAVSAWRGARVR
jgi:hypothetical protein